MFFSPEIRSGIVYFSYQEAKRYRSPRLPVTPKAFIRDIPAIDRVTSVYTVSSMLCFSKLIMNTIFILKKEKINKSYTERGDRVITICEIVFHSKNSIRL